MTGLYVVGFTGTRNGMTRKQLATVQGLLTDATTLHLIVNTNGGYVHIRCET